MDTPKRFKLIACEVLFREICYCVSQCDNIIDIIFMPKGLHDIGEYKMSEKIQTEIDKVDGSKYQAILLGYGLCNNGIRGLHSKLPLIIPRAHDCITLLIGSKKKYDDYFKRKPGTFFKSTGWIERDVNPNETELSVTSQLGISNKFNEYAEQYDEENAIYLMEILGDWFKNYKRLTYIDTKIGYFDRYKKLIKQQAEAKGWEYDELDGSVNLLLCMLNGEWDLKDFLVVPPNSVVKTSFDDDIITF